MFTSNTVIVLLAILAVATYSLVGLLAIWAGMNRSRWFLPVAVIGGILLLLLLVPAYEPRSGLQVAIETAMSPSNDEIVLLVMLTVAAYSLVGLLAIWAGLGRPHWFLRVAVIGGILLLLLLIPAYEPLLLFAIQSAVVILPLMLLRAFRGRVRAVGPDGESQDVTRLRIRPQFSLLDLLLLTVVVAVVVAVVVNVPSDAHVQNPGSLSFLLFDVSGLASVGLGGLGLGISSLAAVWVALGHRRLWLRLIVLCLVPTSAVMAGWLAVLRASGWLAGTRRGSATASPADRATRPRIRRLAKVAIVLLSLLIVFPPTAAFYVLVALAPDPPETVLPDPNGYPDLLKAGKVLMEVNVPDADTATPQQLQVFLARYGPALDTARAGLDRQCIVPVQFSSSYVEVDLPRVQGLRQLARAFWAEGKLAELEGRPVDAVKSYLDSIRLGQAGSHGGMVIDWLAGQAFNGIGVEGLTDLRGTLTPEQCRELMDALRRLNANREPLEDVWARDQLWERIVFGWEVNLIDWLSMIAGSESYLRPALQQADHRCQARLRLLICGLALRSYCVENGEPPEMLADLVPDYLSEVPQDPFSGKPLVYRRDAKGYALYSVGSDRCDDGGQPGNYGIEPGTDMLLDEPAEEQEE